MSLLLWEKNVSFTQRGTRNTKASQIDPTESFLKLSACFRCGTTRIFETLRNLLFTVEAQFYDSNNILLRDSSLSFSRFIDIDRDGSKRFAQRCFELCGSIESIFSPGKSIFESWHLSLPEACTSQFGFRYHWFIDSRTGSGLFIRFLNSKRCSKLFFGFFNKHLGFLNSHGSKLLIRFHDSKRRSQLFFRFFDTHPHTSRLGFINSHPNISLGFINSQCQLLIGFFNPQFEAQLSLP